MNIADYRSSAIRVMNDESSSDNVVSRELGLKIARDSGNGNRLVHKTIPFMVTSLPHLHRTHDHLLYVHMAKCMSIATVYVNFILIAAPFKMVTPISNPSFSR